jgi:hypothetical protein
MGGTASDTTFGLEAGAEIYSALKVPKYVLARPSGRGTFEKEKSVRYWTS